MTPGSRKTAPADRGYWLTSQLADTRAADLIRTAKIRWRIEHDYRKLKTGLGLDHFEGRAFTSWHRHVTLVTAAHLFITLRHDPKAAAPARPLQSHPQAATSCSPPGPAHAPPAIKQPNSYTATEPDNLTKHY